MTITHRRPAAALRTTAAAFAAAVTLAFAPAAALAGAHDDHDHGAAAKPAAAPAPAPHAHGDHVHSHDAEAHDHAGHGTAGPMNKTIPATTPTLTTTDPAAMAREHAHDMPVASPAALRTAPAAAHPVTSRLVSYHQADGREVVGYLAEPADTKGKPVPGVLLVHEWWGLNANIEAMARQLAEQGYAAFAVDLYNGAKAENPDEAMKLVRAATARPAELVANLRAGHAVLARMKRAPSVAALGWCFGGSMALEAGMALGRGVDATVVYYGKPETDPAKLAALKGPVLGIFGGADASIPLPTVQAFEAALKTNRTPVTIAVYDGAGHAFANPSGNNYQPAAAEDAWVRTLAFLKANLR